MIAKVVALVVTALFVLVLLAHTKDHDVLKNISFTDDWALWCSKKDEGCHGLEATAQGLRVHVYESSSVPSTFGGMKCLPFWAHQTLEMAGVVSLALSQPEAVWLRASFYDSDGQPLLDSTSTPTFIQDFKLHTLMHNLKSPKYTATMCVGLEVQKSNYRSDGVAEIKFLSVKHTSFHVEPLLAVFGWLLLFSLLWVFDSLIRQFFTSHPHPEVEYQPVSQSGDDQLLPTHSAPVNKPRFEAIGFVRFIAACHVFLVHTMKTKDLFFAQWGTSWVPFFFFISGFLLTYPRLDDASTSSSSISTTIRTFLDFMWKRFISTYPLYLFSLLLMVGSVDLTCPIQQSNLIAMIFLLQGFAPSYSCRNPDGSCVESWACIDNKVNVPSWFLTSLFVFYIAFLPLLAFVRRLTGKTAFLLLVACWLFSLNAVCVDLIPIASWKYSPLCFFHVFLAGMLLARAFHSRMTAPNSFDGHRMPLVLEYGGLLGLLALGHIMTFYLPSDAILLGMSNERTIEWIGRTGGFIPFHALLIVGLALKTDPLIKIFSLSPFVFLGELSYGWYILQEAAFRLRTSFWPVHQSHNVWVVVVILAVLSLLGRFLVEIPVQKQYSSLFGSSSVRTKHKS
eukprot:c8160_g1_i1.p1 GENE.c8160_g1_i1~~c8160_g1_i1.p1  ORF type:complete len:620 (-),score=131.93 c8160_g1_i1:271-2130(-)